MVITVKLFSVFRDLYPDYDPEKGLRFDFTTPASVADIVTRLGIPASKEPVVACNGRVLKPGDFVADNSVVQIFQPVAGG